MIKNKLYDEIVEIIQFIENKYPTDVKSISISNMDINKLLSDFNEIKEVLKS